MDRKEMQNTRLYLLGVLLIVVLGSYFGVLYDTQVTHHKDYEAQSIRSIVREEKVDASRGIVTDRNGKVLISNRSSHNLTFDVRLIPAEEDVNDAILRLVQLCQKEGVAWTDNLPVTKTAPYAYTIDEMDSVQKGRFLTYLQSVNEFKTAIGSYILRNPTAVAVEIPKEVTEEGEEEKTLTFTERAGTMAKNLTAENLSASLLSSAGITPSRLVEVMRKEMELPSSLSQDEARLVMGVQYELSLRKIMDTLEAYVFAEDIDTDFISILADGRYSGVKVTNSSVREYQTKYAAHILGYMTKLYAEDYKELKNEGYDMDDWIGRDGVELAFEKYLKGTDGYRMVSSNMDGKITGEYYSKEPRPGDIVELTIDINFQQQVEEILEDTVGRMNAADGDPERGGAAAVVKVGTGEVLALASYPTYDPATFRQGENYQALLNDEHSPLLNRATMSAYPPGSTLKPFTAAAALEGGYTTLKEKIRDTGKWYYPGDKNSYFWCWNHAGHGYLNVTQAITNSCNIFFGEMGYRMKMEGLREWLVKFGLGEKTGIEIPESAGLLPENPEGQNQAPWAGFGQSTQLYTPLQLANYIATLVSGGKHCQAHLLKSAKAYDNSEVTAVGNTEPVNNVNISDANLQAIKQGMHGLAHGTLWPYFRNCVVDAGAKTGTAQISSKVKNNSVFVCFAPYDEPEIAVAIAIERGDAGAKSASAAVNILNAYFAEEETEAIEITGENQMLP